MKGHAFINGKDLWETFGAVLRKGAYEALLTPPAPKNYVTNQSRQEHGTRYTSVKDSNGKVFLQQREFQLPIFIKARTRVEYLRKYGDFLKEIENGEIELFIPRLAMEFRLVYINCAKYGDYGAKCGNFALRLIEPDPSNREIDREKYPYLMVNRDRLDDELSQLI